MFPIDSWQIMAVTVRFIIKDAEEKNALFNPRPVFRLFINWLLDLGLLEPVTDGANLQVFVTFSYFFNSICISLIIGYKQLFNLLIPRNIVTLVL